MYSPSKMSRDRLTALVQWICWGALIGVACGAASALFLHLLDLATAFRRAQESIVYALPLAGLALGAVLQRYGASTKAGNSLVIDTIHDDGPEIPLRMAPLALFGTIATHLFGGSAGREGTAVQMGASLTDFMAQRFGLRGKLRQDLLAAGVAGGFGSVFGTPLAGTLFGLEFIVLGSLRYRALVPALVAAVVGDQVTLALGIVHTPYPSVPELSLTLTVLAKWLVFSLAIAATTVAFIELTHRLRQASERYITAPPLRLFAGGLAVVLLWKLWGTGDFLGLGVETIVRSFEDPTLPSSTFAAKLLFTAVTLGFGFLGGEVTPLFFIGAALGNLLARALELPLELGAGVGMAAVFAAASNTPLALSIMAVELLGASVLPHVVVVCVLAFVLTGHRGIYPAQRLTRTKLGRALRGSPRLRDLEP